MKKKVKYLLFLSIFLILTANALAVTEEWDARYGTNRADYIQDLEVDDQGNAYVTGYGGGGMVTIKYDTNGNRLWLAGYHSMYTSQALAAEVDNSNVYVTGRIFDPITRHDLVLIKYDSNGNQVWAETYSHPVNSDDMGRDIAIDSLGNIYVTGTSFGSGTRRDIVTLKYDSNGNQIWVARYGGEFDDNGVDVEVDKDGNVYVFGQGRNPETNNDDYIIIKYDSSGNQQWLARYDNGGYDGLVGGEVDSNGNVYAGGRSYAAGTGYDFATVKFDSNGNQQWVARYDGPFVGAGGEELNDIKLDSSGNIYVVGQSLGDLWDIATVKYDSDGNQLWVERYHGVSHDYGTALDIDSKGKVYITGYTYVQEGSYDFVTIKYDSNGNQEWLITYDGPANYIDFGRYIEVDDKGNVYVAGLSYGVGTSYDYALVKYSQGPSCTDEDGDGYAKEGGDCGPIDCNDNDYYVNPGVSEVYCDNIDNDCDPTTPDNPDFDNDGVNDCYDDRCLASTLDNINLNPNQYAQNINFGAFEVGKENYPSLVYDMYVTKGCTCKQIAEVLGKGEGHVKKGCSPSIMGEWTGISAQPDRAYNSGKITGGAVVDINQETILLGMISIVSIIALVIVSLTAFNKLSKK
ncbi:MAG: SBBP repeat-containing protein [Nanoarchaeota archaeon]|nr:SBBP repeat-containing protein [Nanoarchaeota archaeon]